MTVCCVHLTLSVYLSSCDRLGFATFAQDEGGIIISDFHGVHLKQTLVTLVNLVFGYGKCGQPICKVLTP